MLYSTKPFAKSAGAAAVGVAVSFILSDIALVHAFETGHLLETGTWSQMQKDNEQMDDNTKQIDQKCQMNFKNNYRTYGNS